MERFDSAPRRMPDCFLKFREVFRRSPGSSLIPHALVGSARGICAGCHAALTGSGRGQHPALVKGEGYRARLVVVAGDKRADIRNKVLRLRADRAVVVRRYSRAIRGNCGGGRFTESTYNIRIGGISDLEGFGLLLTRDL